MPSLLALGDSNLPCQVTAVKSATCLLFRTNKTLIHPENPFGTDLLAFICRQHLPPSNIKPALPPEGALELVLGACWRFLAGGHRQPRFSTLDCRAVLGLGKRSSSTVGTDLGGDGRRGREGDPAGPCAGASGPVKTAAEPCPHLWAGRVTTSLQHCLVSEARPSRVHSARAWTNAENHHHYRWPPC